MDSIDLYREGRFGVNVASDNMEPIAAKGDKVLFDPCPIDAVKPGDCCFIQTYDDNTTFRRVLRVTEDAWRVGSPDGSNARDIPASFIVGVALAAVRIVDLPRAVLSPIQVREMAKSQNGGRQ
jgi:hypothetical protein